jgi:hypothetical protein
MKAEAREARVVWCGDAGCKVRHDVAWGRLKTTRWSQMRTEQLYSNINTQDTNAAKRSLHSVVRRTGRMCGNSYGELTHSAVTCAGEL